jgi:VWFA-related protein
VKRIVLAVLLAVPLFAQRFDEAITVNVVDVPVYVERSGQPIRGLTRDDFTLFVDGKPHPIEYFDAVDGKSDRKDAADAPASEPDVLKRRRLVVLLFDLGSSPYALQRGRNAAMKYVSEGAPGDTFAVATIGRSSLRFIAAFTNDRIAVQRAIGTLTPSASRDPFRVATLESERSSWAEVVRGAEGASGTFGDIWGDQVAPGGIGISSAAANAAEFARIAEELQAIEEQEQSVGFIENLAALAERLAPLEGVKEVVLLSDRQAEDGGGGPVLQRATRLHERFRAAGVILNGVDIHPPKTPGGDAGGRGRAASTNLLASPFLYTLALDTGGAVATSLPNLLERSRVAYVLGFQTPPGVTRGAIRVEVKNLPMLADVRYRRSFDLVAEKSGDKGLLLADTLLNDIPQNGVTLDLLVKGTEVTASIPGVELLSYPWDAPLQLEVFFYVFNEEGRPFSWHVLQVAVDLEKGREYLSGHPYRMRQDLALGPGRYVVKALVRIAGTDRVGFDRAPLVVDPS